jgi:hypothetical protein
MNLLYIGVDNPISIAVENVDCKSLIVQTDNGTIVGNNGEYIFHGSKVGPAQITLYKKINGKNRMIGKSYFRVKNFPLPIFKIASGKDRMPKIEIASQLYVRAELENMDIDIKYYIDSFTICIISSDTCGSFIAKNLGNKLNETITSRFSTLKANDVVVFKDIFIKLPDSNPAKLAPVMVTIYD